MNSLSENDVIQYHPIGGCALPRLDSKSKLMMRLYRVFGTSVLEHAVRKLVGLPDKVGIQPGFECLAGQLIFRGSASLADSLLIDYAPIEFGRNVSMSFRNTVVTSTHRIDDFSRVEARPVIIEDGVWITTGVTILGGVRIGEGSVIGAGSVVTKSIPPFCFAAGNPCKPLRKIVRSRNYLPTLQ